MSYESVLNQPLADLMKPEIALILQRVLHVYDVGSFLRLWHTAKGQKNIEQVFDNPQQARHAVDVCSAWLNDSTPVLPAVLAGAWWVEEKSTPATHSRPA